MSQLTNPFHAAGLNSNTTIKAGQIDRPQHAHHSTQDIDLVIQLQACHDLPGRGMRTLREPVVQLERVSRKENNRKGPVSRNINLRKLMHSGLSLSLSPGMLMHRPRLRSYSVGTMIGATCLGTLLFLLTLSGKSY